MGAEVLTDTRIAELLALPKKVTSSTRTPKIKGKHEEMNYELASDDGKSTFRLFTRQNTLVKEDFSAGLIWHAPSGEDVTLTRYNGSNHIHRNHIERDKIVKQCHIHRATERYAGEGRTAEHFAEVAGSYQDLSGALAALAQDCRISGVVENDKQLDLVR